MQVKVREALVADIPEISSLARIIWYPAYNEILSIEQIEYMLTEMYDEVSLLRQMTDLQHSFLLLEHNEALKGFASFSHKDNSTDIFRLHKLYLHPQLQGKGMGKYLIAEVEDRVKASGGTALELNVNRHNKARFFYESAGFKIVKDEDIPIGKFFMNDYVMVKKLV